MNHFDCVCEYRARAFGKRESKKRVKNLFIPGRERENNVNNLSIDINTKFLMVNEQRLKNLALF